MHYVAGNSNAEAFDDFLTSQEEVYMELRKKLLKAQEQTKKYADENRQELILNLEELLKN